MYISELEVDNFKSFAEKITIPFMKGFTTISGPNGSGKSNIIDSILFALGLSSSRTLRVEKLFQFISTHTNRKEAYVQVKFSPENDGEKEIVVCRRIKKTSQGYNSIYYMNGKNSTLSDIHSELEKFNITPNSYNVMMQGDVTSITNCSPNERRKIIDEIAGVADFDRRIEQAKNELEKVEGNVQNSLLILNEVDTGLERLSEEREQALKYQKLKDDKIKLESQITSVKYFDIKRNLEASHQNVLEFTKKKKQEEADLKALEIQLEEVKKNFDEISAQIKANGEEEQLEVKRQLEGVKGDIERKKQAINFADTNIHKNLRNVENAKNGIEVSKEKIETLNKEIEDKKIEISGIEKNIEAEKEELNRILQETAGISKTADEHLATIQKLKQQLDKEKENELQIEKEKLPLENNLTNYTNSINTAKTTIENLKDFKNDFANKKELLENQITELAKEMEDYKLAQQNTMIELDTTKNAINDLSYNIRIATNKLYSLEATKNAFEEQGGLGKEINTVLNSNIKGIHATLAQLGQVDKDYSLALEVAMGNRMKHIVVDDDDVAKVAIQLLKSTGGRATFLPLNKLRQAPSSLKLPKDKGIVDYAINLVDFDEEYIDAFYLALGDTLVVEDYSVAQKLIGKYRMVTLSGEIFEKSGSITGGSQKRSTIKFTQSQDSELETYKQRLGKLQDDLLKLDEKQQTLNKKLDTVREKYSNAMTEHSKAKVELSNLTKNLELNEKSVEENTVLINELTPKIEQTEKLLEKLEEKHVVVNEKILNLEEEITKVESMMSKDELEKLKNLTKESEAKIKELTTKVSTIENEISKLKNDITFNEEMIKTRETSIEELNKDNETLENDKKRYEADIKTLEEGIGVLEEQIRVLGEKLKESQEKRDAIQQELLNLEKKKDISNNNIERINEQVESFKARRRELEPQLEEVRNELFEKGVDVEKLEPLEISTEEITAKIQRLQKRMEDLEPVNMRAITEYDRVLERQNELKTRIDTLSTERKEILERMKGHEQLKKETFLTTYNDINKNFKDIFAKLSDGEGTLILENEEDPFSGGLTIEAQPRDKKKQRLESMSGGEKSLTALAFVFSIQRHMPAPFYAFDEVDMHLDGINVEKLSEMIRYQSNNTQFIVVSLRKPMIESANRTIGVTQKEKGKTRVTGVKLRD